MSETPRTDSETFDREGKLFYTGTATEKQDFRWCVSSKSSRKLEQELNALRSIIEKQAEVLKECAEADLAEWLLEDITTAINLNATPISTPPEARG